MSASFHIRQDDLSGAQVHALLGEHLRDMALLSPPDSVHALDLSGLLRPDICFWTIWQSPPDRGGAIAGLDDAVLLGCGALKAITDTHGEVKSMRTALAHRRKGVARAVLTHILAEARHLGFQRLSLETGSAAAFKPAHALYAAAGFELCGPFEGYVADHYSVFMTIQL